MLALDAAEPALLERWCADGTLPNLSRLRQRGCYGRLESSARWFAGSQWATFSSGMQPPDHGLYGYLAWRPDRMRAQRPGPEWLPLQSFWREIGRRGRRVVAFDIPMAYAPEPFGGLEIVNWASHESVGKPLAEPPEVLDSLQQRFGPPLRHPELAFPLPVERLLALGDQQVTVTEHMTAIGRHLAQAGDWELFLACIATAHRAGHKLWDETGALGSASDRCSARPAIREALCAVYRAVDEAVGQLVEAAGAGTTLLVFSLHGMGPNSSRNELLPEMLDRILAGGQGGDRKRVTAAGMLNSLRESVPIRLRHEVKHRLPLRVQDRLTAFWRFRSRGGAARPAFPLVADLQGYVRVNVAGRERDGRIEPGAQYRSLCDQIAEGLHSFVDAGTGEPVSECVARTDEIYHPGPKRHLLPDLVARWSPVPRHDAVTSPSFGLIPWPTPGIHPTGRSGNHRDEGFLLAVGNGFPAGGLFQGADIADLAPTAYELLDLEPPPGLSGRSVLGRCAPADP
jgi:predicted AlkP superfamily phosphohydrolase/phosphomutase